MPEFLRDHHHAPDECAASFAAWKGFSSPLRGQTAPCACLAGRHLVWWQVSAGSPEEALGLLPRYVAERTTAIPVREVDIP